MGVLNLAGRLSLDASPFHSALKGVSGSVGGLATSLKGMLGSVLSVSAISGMARSIIAAGSEIKDLSDRLAVSAKDVQEFGLAAKLSGQDAETFAKSLERIRIAAAKGETALSIFGVTTEQMRAGVPALRQLAEGLKQFTGSAEQTKALADVFGVRGFGKTVNMLLELKAAGGVQFFTDRDIDNLDRAGDSITKFWTKMKVGGLRAFEWIGNREADLIDMLFGTDIRGFGKPDKRNRKKKFQMGGLEEGAFAEEEKARARLSMMERVEKLNEKAEKFRKQAHLATITDEEELKELQEERARLKQENFEDWIDEEAIAKKSLALAENEAAIAEVSERIRNKKNLESVKGLPPLTDSLRAVGNFLGGDPNSGVVKQLSEQTKQLEKIERNTARQGAEGSRFPL